jgi:thioredoxin-like negative regulator of GroEL
MDDLDAEMPESISDAGFDEVEVRNLVGRVEDEVGPREDVAEAAAEGLRDFTDGDFDELREYTEEVYDQMQENTEMPDAIEDAGFSEDQVEGFLQRVAAENEDVDDLAYRAASGVLELVGEDVDLDEVEEYFQRVYQDMDV